MAACLSLRKFNDTLFGLLLERNIYKQLNLIFTSYGVLLMPQFYLMILRKIIKKARHFFIVDKTTRNTTHKTATSFTSLTSR